MKLYLIPIASVLLQFLATFLALRLIWITERVASWMIIAGAIFFNVYKTLHLVIPMAFLHRFSTSFRYILRNLWLVHLGFDGLGALIDLSAIPFHQAFP
jgi:hypothetical protein